MGARLAWIPRIASSHPPSPGPTGHTQRAQLTPTTAHNSLVPPHVSCQQPRAVARPLLSIRHLPGTLARCTEWFATRESSGPSPAARTALQPWRHCNLRSGSAPACLPLAGLAQRAHLFHRSLGVSCGTRGVAPLGPLYTRPVLPGPPSAVAGPLYNGLLPSGPVRGVR